MAFLHKLEENFNTKRFIALIRSKISLWDYNSDEFKDKMRKQQDWLAVCNGIIPNYAERNNKEKKLILLRLQSKWKALRDGFVRNLRNRNKKTGKAAALAKKYTYHDHLLFLVGKCKRDLLSLTRNMDISQLKDVNKDSDSDDSEDCIPLIGKDIKKEASTLKQKIHVPEPSDEDRQFFLSLLKDCKRITEDFKLDAKGDIINVIRHYVNKSNCQSASRSPKLDLFQPYLRGDLQVPEETSVKMVDKRKVIGKDFTRGDERRHASENDESSSSGAVEREPEYIAVAVKNEDAQFQIEEE